MAFKWARRSFEVVRTWQFMAPWIKGEQLLLQWQLKKLLCSWVLCLWAEAPGLDKASKDFVTQQGAINSYKSQENNVFLHKGLLGFWLFFLCCFIGIVVLQLRTVRSSQCLVDYPSTNCPGNFKRWWELHRYIYFWALDSIFILNPAMSLPECIDKWSYHHNSRETSTP